MRVSRWHAISAWWVRPLRPLGGITLELATHSACANNRRERNILTQYLHTNSEHLDPHTKLDHLNDGWTKNILEDYRLADYKSLLHLFTFRKFFFNKVSKVYNIPNNVLVQTPFKCKLFNKVQAIVHYYLLRDRLNDSVNFDSSLKSSRSFSFHRSCRTLRIYFESILNYRRTVGYWKNRDFVLNNSS